MSSRNSSFDGENVNKIVDNTSKEFCALLLAGARSCTDEMFGAKSEFPPTPTETTTEFTDAMAMSKTTLIDAEARNVDCQENPSMEMPFEMQMSYLIQAIRLYNQQFSTIDNSINRMNNLNARSGTAYTQNYYQFPSTYLQNDISKVSLLGMATAAEHQRHEQRKQRDNHDGFGTRRPHKHQTNEFQQVDYNKINVDLSLIGMTTKSVERNFVLRLFGLFRQMHIYLHEKLPSRFNSAIYDEYEDQFTARSTMPCTMNVQTQIKQVLHKCTIFLCNLEKLLNLNKLSDPELYITSERSVMELKRLIQQLDSLKSMNFDHNYGKFVKEETNAHAQQLEMLLERMNDSIRENKICVHLFNWKMEAKRKDEDKNWNIGDDQATGTDVSNYTKTPICMANFKCLNDFADVIKNHKTDKKSLQLEHYFNNDNEFC